MKQQTGVASSTSKTDSIILGIALKVVGVIFIVGIPAMMMWIWPAGWSWTPPQ